MEEQKNEENCDSNHRTSELCSHLHATIITEGHEATCGHKTLHLLRVDILEQRTLVVVEFDVRLILLRHHRDL